MENLGRQRISLPGELQHGVDALAKDWEAEGLVARLWSGDATLWTGADEDRWLGWLRVLDAWDSGEQAIDLPDSLRNLEGSGRPIEDVVVMGMGGSSLGPDLVARTFGRLAPAPTLRVLDSTVPAQIRRLESELDVGRTLFVVPSKSGSTIEPNCFWAHFRHRVAERVGEHEAGRQFLAITDPSTGLDERARQAGFASIQYGIPSIGGRFSALSVFGMVPAALAGVDVETILGHARVMADACEAPGPIRENPGATLGLVLGSLAGAGRDKLTLVTDPKIRSLGGWLEQLIAESTGKGGVGIIPVDGEALTKTDRYGSDRVFAYIGLASGQDEPTELAELEAAGHPLIRIELPDLLHLGAEFFRWEFATAVAGAVLGINPFDQPDVEAAKVAARSLMDEYERTGALPSGDAAIEENGLGLHPAPGLETSGSLQDQLAAHVDRVGPGDYFAINAFIEMCPEYDARLQRIRQSVRDATGAATTLGYGPRFLHSTGQLHKGGPNSGVFLHLTCDDPEDLPVPDQSYTFGALKDAQAQGDFQVLAERGRRIVRVHLGSDPADGLDELSRVFASIANGAASK